MIIKETINENLVRHYSDDKKKIRQIETGLIYAEAVDVIPCEYTYEEVEELPVEEEATTADYEEALKSLGVSFDEEDNVE